MEAGSPPQGEAGAKAKVRHRPGDDDDPMQLGEGIVIRQMPSQESAPLVARVEAARLRTETALGLDGGGP